MEGHAIKKYCVFAICCSKHSCKTAPHRMSSKTYGCCKEINVLKSRNRLVFRVGNDFLVKRKASEPLFPIGKAEPYPITMPSIHRNTWQSGLWVNPYNKIISTTVRNYDCIIILIG